MTMIKSIRNAKEVLTLSLSALLMCSSLIKNSADAQSSKQTTKSNEELKRLCAADQADL